MSSARRLEFRGEGRFDIGGLSGLVSRASVNLLINGKNMELTAVEPRDVR